MTIVHGVVTGNREGRKQDVKHEIVIMGGTDCVGKSTIARNLAFSILEKGAAIGLLDFWSHGLSHNNHFSDSGTFTHFKEITMKIEKFVQQGGMK